jgi:hypothetical protein
MRLIGSASTPSAAALSFMWNSAMSGRGQLLPGCGRIRRLRESAVSRERPLRRRCTR